MKGIVFNLLEEVVTDAHGEQVWDALLDATGLSGSYTSLGSYPDEHLEQLLQAAASALDTPPGEVLRWFGTTAMPLLAKRYPSFFSAHSSARPFVLSVNSIIHPEVRKLYPGADVPFFDFSDEPDGSLLMGYRSPRKLCLLSLGFIEGAAAYYHESTSFEHLECMHHGDSRCQIKITFSAGGAR